MPWLVYVGTTFELHTYTSDPWYPLEPGRVLGSIGGGRRGCHRRYPTYWKIYFWRQSLQFWCSCEIQSKFSAFKFLQTISFWWPVLHIRQTKFASVLSLFAEGVLLSFINDLLSHLFSSQDVLDQLKLVQVIIADGVEESAVAMWVSSSAEMSESPGSIMYLLLRLELRYPKISWKLRSLDERLCPIHLKRKSLLKPI